MNAPIPTLSHDCREHARPIPHTTVSRCRACGELLQDEGKHLSCGITVYGPDDPFVTAPGPDGACVRDVRARLRMVPHLSVAQLRAALVVPGVQKKVRDAVGRRLMKIDAANPGRVAVCLSVCATHPTDTLAADGVTVYALGSNIPYVMIEADELRRLRCLAAQAEDLREPKGGAERP